jgi:hypothetical protein
LSEERELIPIEQQTLTFNGKPLIVVRLPDGRAGIVLRWLCENLGLDTPGQIQRIQRTEVIAGDMVYMQIQTDGGPQTMATLVLHGLAYWLATIDTRRMDRADPRRAEILAYQRDAVDALYAWASTPRTIASPAKLVPSEPIAEPVAPGPDASNDDWIIYHQQMLQVLEWRRDVEVWRGGVETRLEGLEAIIPDILDRLPPQTLSPAHQQQLQAFVKQLHDATGKPYPTIYDNLKTAFQVARYQDIPDAEWDKVANWFRVQLQGKKR